MLRYYLLSDFVPSVTVFGDIEEANGVYALFDVFVPYELSEFVSLAGVILRAGEARLTTIIIGPQMVLVHLTVIGAIIIFMLQLVMK